MGTVQRPQGRRNRRRGVKRLLEKYTAWRGVASTWGGRNGARATCGAGLRVLTFIGPEESGVEEVRSQNTAAQAPHILTPDFWLLSSQHRQDYCRCWRGKCLISGPQSQPDRGTRTRNPASPDGRVAYENHVGVSRSSQCVGVRREPDSLYWLASCLSGTVKETFRAEDGVPDGAIRSAITSIASRSVLPIASSRVCP